jgi:hypothetical protein
LDCYGVPRKGEFYTDDAQRAFIKNPLNQSNPEIKGFCDTVLHAIDQWASTDQFKETVFGDTAHKYKKPVQACFRYPQEEEQTSSKKDKKVYPRHPYMKIKLDMSYSDNPSVKSTVKTLVFNSIMEDGKRVRTKIEDIESVDDFSKYLTYMCRYRPIIRLVKFWAQAPKMSDPNYGFTFKLVKVEIEPSSHTTNNINEFLTSDAFLDSDDEGETSKPKKVIKSAPTPAPVVTPAAAAAADSSDDEPPAPVVVKKKQVARVDSDEESDDPPAPVVTKKKQVAQVDSDESDEESSDEPVKIAKKPVTKKVESDDESSDEPVKLAKKPAKKVVTKAKKATA